MKPLHPLLRALAAVAVLLAAEPASALEGRVVVTGLSQPLLVTAPKGDRRLFVVEKTGMIRLVRGDRITTFLDLSDRVALDGERGLLGMAFDPHYAINGRFYVDYVDKVTLQTRIERYTVSPPDANRADRRSRQKIIVIDQPPYPNHKGGWLAFRPGQPRNLWIGMGDGGSANDPGNRAQDGQVLLGKLLRLDVSGSTGGYEIPRDNPFVGSKDVRPEIWALGLRNPFRASFDRETGALWIGDVGQYTREEIDFERPNDPGGHNYGWRLREGRIRNPNGVGGSDKGMTDPVYDYPHSGHPNSLGDCVIGGYVYHGPSIPQADGRYFFGDCVSDRAFSFSFNEHGKPIELQEVTAALLGGSGLSTLSSFGEDGRGRLYVVGQSGVVVVMCPSGGVQRRPAPDLGDGAGPKVHVSVADPCGP
ncbi:PQQ-dependent sugar dehydrogenase [Ideonella sp. YS5]|uniref:PQQ-dependent sugar dehydrogenase n=1 Tax=Ideonella sp. YS5 TaxID=3453714 RepID=UPI003EEB3407